MGKMKAVQVSKAGGPFEVVERDVPQPGPGQIRVKVAACGICHSDALTRGGQYPGLTLPRVPGHEVAGRVDALGAGVTQWKVGERVGVGWHGGHCFVCNACRRGLFINCERAQVTGLTFDGGYAEYLVAPQEAAARIPADLKDTDAAPLMCAGITTYNALRNIGARPGDTVAVQGIGGLGHLGVQFAARMGFRTVAISRGNDKEDLARQLGAHEYVDTEKESLKDGLQKLGGADVILATAPNAEAITAALDGLKARGKLLVVAAAHEPSKIATLNLLSGRAIQGWPSGSAIDSEDAMSFSALARVRPQTEIFTLEQAEEAFTKVMQNRVRFRAVLTP
jgi:D-arabinose 1-dehydrogenase-like Zn-dependent alcohol dehydrogenase